VLIGGFIVTGSAPKKVIVRAIGPSLGNFGVTGFCLTPRSSCTNRTAPSSSTTIGKIPIKHDIEATGLAPSDDLESAVLETLAPGTYTAIVAGTNGTTGIGLVEAYDLDQPVDSELANISTRGFIDTGDNVMIGGFIIGLDGFGDGTVLVRGIGPSLTDFGVPGALQDPTLELHDASGNTLTTNDDWKETQQTEIEATGLAPSDDRESAILSTLAPGAYTAIVRGALRHHPAWGLVEGFTIWQVVPGESGRAAQSRNTLDSATQGDLCRLRRPWTRRTAIARRHEIQMIVSLARGWRSDPGQ
jgi:hypothetical protein